LELNVAILIPYFGVMCDQLVFGLKITFINTHYYY
jgi:hypothetical protein